MAQLPAGSETLLGIFDLRGFRNRNADLGFVRFLVRAPSVEGVPRVMTWGLETRSEASLTAVIPSLTPPTICRHRCCVQPNPFQTADQMLLLTILSHAPRDAAWRVVWKTVIYSLCSRAARHALCFNRSVLSSPGCNPARPVILRL